MLRKTKESRFIFEQQPVPEGLNPDVAVSLMKDRAMNQVYREGGKIEASRSYGTHSIQSTRKPSTISVAPAAGQSMAESMRSMIGSMYDQKTVAQIGIWYTVEVIKDVMTKRERIEKERSTINIDRTRRGYMGTYTEGAM